MKVERLNQKILKDLLSDDFISAAVLAKKYNVSDRTIRQRISLLNDTLKENGAEIKVQYGKGYRLEITNQVLYVQFLAKRDDVSFANSREERIDFIITKLASEKNYFDFMDFCDLLYFSESTLNIDFKIVKDILKNYNLDISSKKGSRIKIEGNEFNIRLCLVSRMSYSLNAMNHAMIISSGSSVEAKKLVFQIISETLLKYKLSMPEVSLDNMVNYISLSLWRIRKGYCINSFADIDLDELTKTTIDEICDKITQTYPNIIFTEHEKSYLGLFVSGQRGSNRSTHSDNIFIGQDSLNLVDSMLDFIYKTLNFDLRHNFNLIMDLALHMVPLAIRIKYNIGIENPLMQDIKHSYSFGYIIAVQASNIINNFYNCKLSEDEICYLALIFELYVIRRKDIYKKKNIVIVCATGKSSANLIAHQYRKLFDRYIDKIVVSNVDELNFLNFTDIDYIFATVPIRYDMPVPIIEIKEIINKSEMERILLHFQKNIASFSVDDIKWYDKLFNKNLFMSFDKKMTKEQALSMMVQNVGIYYNLPRNFYDSILERERIDTTDFSALIALPHPFGVTARDTFVSVLFNEQSIFWGKKDVNIVILISMADDKPEEIKRMLQSLSDFIMDNDKKNVFIKNGTYDNFVKLCFEENR